MSERLSLGVMRWTMLVALMACGGGTPASDAGPVDTALDLGSRPDLHEAQCEDLRPGVPCSFVEPCHMGFWDDLRGRCGEWQNHCVEGQVEIQSEYWPCPLSETCATEADSISAALTSGELELSDPDRAAAHYRGTWCDPSIELYLEWGEPREHLLWVDAPMPFDLSMQGEPFEGDLVLEATVGWGDDSDGFAGTLTLRYADRPFDDGRMRASVTVDAPELTVDASVELAWCSFNSCL